MTENNPEFFGDIDEPDLELPEDGRDSQPPPEGSSDEPEMLDEDDPLRNSEAVLSESTSPSTLTGQETEPLQDDDWALEEQRVLDETELDEILDEEDDE